MKRVYHPYTEWECWKAGMWFPVTGEKKAGMSDAWILKHIGMDKDELLRLKQITGIAALFKDAEFSKAYVNVHAAPEVA